MLIGLTISSCSSSTKIATRHFNDLESIIQIHIMYVQLYMASILESKTLNSRCPRVFSTAFFCAAVTNSDEQKLGERQNPRLCIWAGTIDMNTFGLPAQDIFA